MATGLEVAEVFRRHGETYRQLHDEHLGRTERRVTVSLPGGELAIEWRASDDHVLMTGPVAYEHKGRFDAALFADLGAA